MYQTNNLTLKWKMTIQHYETADRGDDKQVALLIKH